VVPVRLDPNLCAAVEERATNDHTTTSDVIREALRRYLDVA
jgi:metal-responsive CopG/Arc/MetJ family transcriptional regulator